MTAALRRACFTILALVATSLPALAQESGGVPESDALDPWIGYALTAAIAGLGIFFVCKTARRS